MIWQVLRQSMEIAQRERTGFSQDFRVICLDGTIRWLHSEGKFMYSPSGEVERMLGITVDITERKRDVEALEKSEQQFSLAFEAARLGWWVWNQETGNVTLSEVPRQSLVCPAVQKLLVDCFLDSVHPEDRERVYRKWWQSFDEDAHYLVEYRVLRTDGMMQWVEARGRAYSDGKSVQIVGVTIDTTERRRAEEALRALGGRLIKAQEEERIRISRELHDDISQRLALLGVELERLSESPAVEDSRLQQAIGASGAVYRRNWQQRAGFVARVAFLQAGNSWHHCRYEKLLCRICPAARGQNHIQQQSISKAAQ